jgi:putative membrane protein insertion efficiency factor
MTKECQMTNDEWSNDNRPAIRHSSFVIRVLTLAIRAYQLTISPALAFLFGPTGGCRFTPSCSQYAMDAIHAHGALTGGALAARRICRCHPWGGCGHDPVPKKEFRIQNSESRI